MRPSAALLLVLFVAAPAQAGSWTTNSFRTGSGDLVRTGDTMTEVVRAAGAPLYRRVLSTGISIGDLVGLSREQWTYRGYDGIYVVTFAGSTVVQIEVLPDR